MPLAIARRMTAERVQRRIVGVALDELPEVVEAVAGVLDGIGEG
jgi:hypothetical protein